MTVTIYDVAREAGVSMATVSRVVNNNPNVKPQTRKKVFEAIERLGYRPNAVARGLGEQEDDDSRRRHSRYFQCDLCGSGAWNRRYRQYVPLQYHSVQRGQEER